MFATLGPIPFRLITYFSGVTNRRGHDYAEHKVIEGKPRLQYMGDSLERVVIDILLHRSFCEPESELARLHAAGSSHMALPFIYGSGRYVGQFVIAEVQTVSRQTNRRGALVEATARVTLTEHAGLGGLLGALLGAIVGAATASGAGPLVQVAGAGAALAGSAGAGDVAASAIVRQ